MIKLLPHYLIKLIVEGIFIKLSLCRIFRKFCKAIL